MFIPNHAQIVQLLNLLKGQKLFGIVRIFCTSFTGWQLYLVFSASPFASNIANPFAKQKTVFCDIFCCYVDVSMRFFILFQCGITTIPFSVGAVFPLHADGKIVPKDQVKDYVLELMEKCGLRDYYYERYPHEFSGGQRQRICIARALSVKPKLVICDEPVSALDVSIQAQIINLLKKLQKEMNLSYVFISHDLSVVKFISDKIGVMYLGGMMEFGKKEDIFRNPLHPYTKALLSAVPNPDPTAKMERIKLEGDIPSPANPPKGCRFHTRCPYAKEVCKHVPPQYTEVEPGHFAACHLLCEE